MNEGTVLDIFNQALALTLKLSGPMLAMAVGVGLIIAILQAATQVHEQTLTFAPKAVAVSLMLLAFGPWMIQQMMDFMYYIFELMGDIRFE